MGRADDPGAVVDPEARVIGVEGLRVWDSSIFPQITNGNLNAPSIMVGEKISDLLLGRPPLPREAVESWREPPMRGALGPSGSGVRLVRRAFLRAVKRGRDFSCT